MRFLKLSILLSFCYFLYVSTIFGQFGSQKDLVSTEVYQSFNDIHSGSELKVALKIQIEDGWHINSDKPHEDFLIPSSIEIESKEGFTLTLAKFPKAKDLEFQFSDKPVSVFEGEILLGAILKVPTDLPPGPYSFNVNFTYQACNDMTCMPPKTVIDTINVNVVNNKSMINEINSEIFSGLDLSYTAADPTDEDSLAAALESSGIVFALLLVFLGGLALNLTPCVYPLIPITIGYFGAQSEGRTFKLFLLGLFFVLGMALTYSVVGVITALSGAVFGSLLQSPVVIILIVLVLIGLSLSMFGLYEFKLPDSLVNKAGGSKSGVFGAFMMGLTMGIVAAPCIGPFVLGLVTYVAAKADPYYGFLLFFFLALGLGLPYLFLAIFSGKIKNLPKAGFWMEAVKHIFGFILIGMAIYFLNPLLPGWLSDYLLPGYIILAALYLLFVDKLANDIKGFRIFKTVFSLIVIVGAIYTVWPSEKASPDWQTYSEEKYSEALVGGNKIIVDFYADWCIPCKELDAFTFSDPAVIEKSGEFIAFKVDMTSSMSETTEKIKDKFKVIGMPTVVFVGSNGKESNRITGFIDAEEMLRILSSIY